MESNLQLLEDVINMFVSHENHCKKNFQKPNILRKKSKATVRTNVQGICIPPETQSLTSQETSSSLLLDSFNGYNCNTSLDIIRRPAQSFKLENGLDSESNKLPATDMKLIMDNSVIGNNMNMNNNEEDFNQAVNVESFFNKGVTDRENVLLFNLNPDKELRTLVVIDDESQLNNMYAEQNQELITNMVPLSSVSLIKPHNQRDEQPAPTTTATPEQDLFQQLIASPVKFKCDSPNCNKEFRSEQKLKKHKNVHNKEGGSAPRQITVECPVKKINSDGIEQPCGKIYLVRSLLVKHLNEDHTLEDASYRCEECGRKFFWASGLRAHTRSHWARAAGAAGAGAGAEAGAGAYACSWPGCGRQFRQPCRLREHARAHTGDRPYPCPYPNCGWSFRSASKLERHARRHTGERRHACGACGRAFHRRDHLRDHAARHRARPAATIAATTTVATTTATAAARRRGPHRCTHEGCEHVFSNMSSLYMHMKKVHRKQETNTTIIPTEDAPSLLKNNWDLIFLTVEGVTETSEEKEVDPRAEAVMEGVVPEVEEGVVSVVCAGEAERDGQGEDTVAEEGGGGAARTHCPWPLQSRAPRDFVIEEDVEPSENSESNIYTVRSDLFLHGNVLINEDSEHMGGVSEVGAEAEAEAEASADDALGELGLLDAHPTIDLMQEELMYTVWQ
ncbi:zinc finger protein 28 homolog isoform X2 [Galleria mellonella]|uniref:Zinc finger protein 28 homolog isoform X2 n=1 Tax=Galleria mellonella TaxID=7137 RepID=A0ABM3N3Y2_GALME|nr:zinc finger protein 28 homolog isoform X2 [Galleria mellonella]